MKSESQSESINIYISVDFIVYSIKQIWLCRLKLYFSIHKPRDKGDSKSDKKCFLASKVYLSCFNPLSANPTKWSNTQTIRRLLPTKEFLFIYIYYVIYSRLKE